MMHIIINKSVSARSYDFRLPRSFLTDEENHISYFLKGDLSCLWKFIVDLQDYNEIKKYAKQYKIDDILPSFLNLLKRKNLINFDWDFDCPKIDFPVFIISDKDKKFPYYIQRVQNLICKENKINQLYLQLTYKCNLKCRHCFMPQNAKECEITYEKAKEIIDEAYDLGINNVRISGGECTLSRDFIKIIRYIRQKYLSYSFVTNGQMLYEDESLFNEIINTYPNNIKISLYSMEENVHDFITGVKGSHYKTLNVINRLKKHNINVTIACFLMKYNAAGCKAVNDFAKEINADITFDTIFIDNPGNLNSYVKLSEEETEVLYLNKNYPNNIYNSELKRMRTNVKMCEAGYMLLNVMPNLDITPCVNVKYKLGNFKTDSLTKIWNEVIPRFRQNLPFKNTSECNKHPYCRYCRFCPAIAMYSEKSKKKPVSICDDAMAYYNALNKI